MLVVFIIRCILFVSNVCQFSLLKIHAKRLKHVLLFYSYVSMTTTKSKATVSSSLSLIHI